MPGKKPELFNVLGDLKDMFAYEKSSDDFALHHRQRYATMEMKTMLPTILKSFTVQSLDGRDKVLPLMLITK
ncbi:hypothetical protein TNIN_66251 [Trichonephila inaurata madagascariensis]|uniref:Uncharacterized protein n=1 Tax=Trichonephila inaurata madagascariensis TaxID=2747483 RepID=A0A8X6XXV9_9ARAC|nr:hypothetical protein TNIN_66251 [Trichonephila inaurata madagascariensis]